MTKSSLAASIEAIGNRLVLCQLNCEGASSAANDTPPRCLYLEEDATTECGVIVVGLNPGRASPGEIDFYKREGLTYGATTRYLAQNMAGIGYYLRVRELLRRIGLQGSILWTEIAKCELLCGFGNVTLDMQRNCTRTFLSHELAACPGWPVVATGRTAFDATALLAADRSVIGVPHPTGAWGSSFNKATGNTETGLGDKERAAISAALTSKKALWLGGCEKS